MNNRKKISITSIKSDKGFSDFKPLKDENGLYIVRLGEFGTHNSAGEYYTLTGIKEMFENSSSFMRRVKNGALKSEMGHPKRLPGMSVMDFVARCFKIYETQICNAITEVWLEESGKGSFYVYGKVKPMGPYASTVTDALECGDINSAFSIRAKTTNTITATGIQKDIEEIFTWDFVNEPGISTATKWKSVGIEDLATCDLESESVQRELSKVIEDNESLVSTESGDYAVEQLKNLQTKKTNTIYDW